MGSCYSKSKTINLKKNIKLTSKTIEKEIRLKQNKDVFIERYKKLSKTFSTGECNSVCMVQCLLTSSVRVAKDFK